MVNFPTWILDCGSHSPALLDLFISSAASICSTIFYHVVSVCIDLPSNSQPDAPFHHIASDYSWADLDCLHHHLRDDPWKDILKLSASAASNEFCEWVQVGIDVYVPHRKYQVKPHSSPRFFSAACDAAIFHRNHFFYLYQQNNPIITPRY